MFKEKVAILSLVSAAILLVAGVAFGGIIDPCQSSATAAGGCVFICPGGDGGTLGGGGTPIYVTVNDGGGVGIEGIPASDFWLIDCTTGANMALCYGSASSDADSSTNSSGITTISGRIDGGGCVDGVRVVVQGYLVGCPAICLSNIKIRSPDMTGDKIVDIADFGSFGGAYPPYPPGVYDTCADFDCSGTPIDLADFSAFGLHYTHACP